MSKFNLTRRSFFKVAAVSTVLAASGIAAAPLQALAEETTGAAGGGNTRHIRTMCRACGKMECGVWVTTREGRVVKIEGDDTAWGSFGNCCTKSQASIQAAYHPDRLRYPKKRSNPKGDNDPGWVRISWDEAITIMCESINTTQDKYGKPTLMQMCGTSRIWANTASRGLGSFFKTPNMHAANQICKGPRREAGSLTIQNGIHFMANVDRPSVYVQWGTDQTQSNYDDSCRTINEVIQGSTCFISIDPRICNAGKEADYHLAIRPGSDQAIAYAWTRIVMDRELYNDTLVKFWSNAPFLYCPDVERSGWLGVSCNASPAFELKTRLLKESDLVEGGDVHKFMVWNNETDSLAWYNGNEKVDLWEGQTEHDYPTTGFKYKYGGWVPDIPAGPKGIDPALWCEGDGFPVTLKDGRQVKCKTVWQMYWDECVKDWTLEKAAQVCDVDANLIEQSCLAWATRVDDRFGNGGLNAQLAPEQAGTAIQTFRTIYLLFFMTDNYDVPGGNRGVTRSGLGSSFPPYSAPSSGAQKSNWESRSNMVGIDRFPLTRWWDAWTDATSIWDAAHEGTPYPVRAAMCVSGDFMNQSNATYGFEALKSMDFLVVVDLWETPTARIADVVMPCSHWMEVPGFIRTSQGSTGHTGVAQQCCECPGDALYEGQIVQKLYKYMGTPFFDPKSGDAWDQPWSVVLDSDAKKTGLAKDWNELCEVFQKHGFWSIKEIRVEDWGTYRRYLMGYERNPDSSSRVGRPNMWDKMPGFKTPTMKVEMWSTIIETYLSPDEPTSSGACRTGSWKIEELALPKYKEPPLSPISTPDLYKEYPLNMTTGRRIPVYFHNEHRQLPWCRELWPVPRVELHPDDAKALGVDQGDWVWIESKWGKVRQVVDLYPGIKPGIINAEHQWWFPESESYTKGYELCSINCLVDKDAQDPICGESQLRAYPVKVYKCTPENCPDGRIIPVDTAGIEIISSATDPRLAEWLPDYEGRE
ncbi:MAG: molybdopterin-dependent oxidoreductase [Coriobacteriales bacterium]|nr:molybdopterin-dependent oxidoreductase [Coriobacteriales bacterium]MBQ6586600.1 molybdopterin-dependent oxidoreductase [Coriobacteriales bacterium]